MSSRALDTIDLKVSSTSKIHNLSSFEVVAEPVDLWQNVSGYNLLVSVILI